MGAEISSVVVVLEDKSDATRLGLEGPSPNPTAGEDYGMGLILGRIRAAQNPIIIVESLAGTPHSLNSTRLFVESSGFPCFTTPMAKGIIDETLINFRGLYVGKISEPTVFEQVQSSDLILVLGPRPTDFSTGGFKTDLPHIETIKFEPHRSQMQYQGIMGLGMKGVLERLSNAFEKEQSRSVSTASTASKPPRKLGSTPDIHGNISPSSNPQKESVDGDEFIDFEGNILDKCRSLTQEWIWPRLAS